MISFPVIGYLLRTAATTAATSSNQFDKVNRLPVIITIMSHRCRLN